MVVHVALLAVPAVAAGGFLQAFQFAFVLWPFNLALPLARHLPRACITLRSMASFYVAELRRYVDGARRGVQPPSSPQLTMMMSHHQQQQYYASSLRGVRRVTPEEVVAHAMIALVDISY
ncbi:hypothetical protein PR202_gb14137 [Eleusine coracana subsp. coracana]|uniref:Uncharacterized protein n=1 Tax=Eleusine coracana subsp. coracana TaxID=191504 RepID=A0AAV5ETV5_ELECO|nr:hypothetical protein QOZ80_4BG0332260 [Eleusine coracana subsp. coracana]GJN26223.1 hypothetical protein PR202_gb14137 [Eleusine coracana subsp. coracana]